MKPEAWWLWYLPAACFAVVIAGMLFRLGAEAVYEYLEEQWRKWRRR